MPESTPPSASHASLLLVESARYALLRRLAFAMRHQMVVHLQPIGMVTEVMERRLRSPTPDMAQVHDSMAKIHGFSKAAVQSCLDVITWMAPDPAASTPLDDGARECLGLLRSNFSFRGFALRDELSEAPLPVARSALRNVLPACLLALTDVTASPAEIVVRSEMGDEEASLHITARPVEGTVGFSGDAPYRLLQWHEVEALARADNVEVTRGADGAQLLFRA